MDKYDGITISDTITESFMNNGTFNSEAIGKAYDLKLRTDLTSLQAKYHIENDTSNVYEVIKTYDQQLLENQDANTDFLNTISEDTSSIETILLNAKDPLNSAIATMDVEHYEIHEGEHYFCSCVQAVAGNGTIDYVLEVGAKPVHLVFSVSGNDAGISGSTYENIVANADGTVMTARNNNRMSSNVSTIVNRVNPTGVVITNALLLRNFRSGAGGNPSQRQVGSVERNREVILKSNTKYLVRTTNLSTSTNNISFDFSWYEL